MLRQILLLGESPQQNYFTEKMAEKLQKDHPEMDEQTILDLFTVIPSGSMVRRQKRYCVSRLL